MTGTRRSTAAKPARPVAGKRIGTQSAEERKRRLAWWKKQGNRLFWQSVISLVIFLTVFVGGGLFGRSGALYAGVQDYLTREDNLFQSVEALGTSISDGASWGEALRDWCTTAFLPTQVEEAQETEDLTLEDETQHQLASAADHQRILVPGRTAWEDGGDAIAE